MFWKFFYSFSNNDCQLAVLKLQTPTSKTHNRMCLCFRGSTCMGSGALWADCTFVAAELRLCMSSAKRMYTRQVEWCMLQQGLGMLSNEQRVCRYESNEGRSPNSRRPIYKSERDWVPQQGLRFWASVFVVFSRLRAPWFGATPTQGRKAYVHREGQVHSRYRVYNDNRTSLKKLCPLHFCCC